jgi:hypothetical protein
VPPPNPTSLLRDALHQALATVSRLPESEEARDLRDQCLAYKHIAEQWVHEPPAPQEREALMRNVLALHIRVVRMHKSTVPPPRDREDE